MRKTFLLIEVIRKPLGQNEIRPFTTVIEDIHGISDDIDKLKGVADEEHYAEPLNWVRKIGDSWVAKKSTHTTYEIIQVNDYDDRMGDLTKEG
jgi:hypothetical protein